MLNKVLIGTIVNAILNLIRVFVPGMGEIPLGVAEAITVVVVALIQYFTPESTKSLASLTVKVK